MNSSFASLRFMPLVASLTTLIIAPGIVFDPINLPKSAILISGAAFFLPALLSNARDIFRLNSALFSIAILFLLFLLFAFILNEGLLAEQLFGIWGRSTGFLAYFSLTVILLTAFLISAQGPNKSLLVGLERTSYFVTTYTVIQYADLDPINWSQKLPFATLGNINFMSSFLGLASISMISRIIFERCSTLRRLHYSFLVSLNLLLILGSGSIQGLAVLLVGGLILISFWVRARHESVKGLISLLLSSLVLGSLLMLGTLGLGPFSRFEQQSVLYRLDYWRAGIRMTLDNPIDGVGIDSYGFFYKQYRDLEAILRTGPERVSNTAHNVFLDISSGAGIVAGVCLVVIFILVLFQSFSCLKEKHSNSVDNAFIAMSAGYLVFCLISINQLGVAVWGFISLGYTSGIRFRPIEKADAVPKKNKLHGNETYKSRSDKGFTRRKLRTSLLSLVLGLGITAVPFYLEVKMFYAEREQNYSAMKEVAQDNFAQTFYREKYILALVTGGQNQEALDFAREELGRNSRSEVALRVVAFSNLSSELEKREAGDLLKSLDPLNEQLKAELGKH